MFNSVPKRLYDEALADRRAADARLLELVQTTVPRAVHEEVVRQYQRQLDVARVDRSHAVAREVHDTTVEALRQQLERCLTALDRAQGQLQGVMTEALAIKRNEQGMPPTMLDLDALDVMHGLGPKTQGAIEEFAAGDVELRRYLIGHAHSLVPGLRERHRADGDLDHELAKIILEGDR